MYRHDTQREPSAGTTTGTQMTASTRTQMCELPTESARALLAYMHAVVVGGDAAHLVTARPWALRICQTDAIMSSVDNELTFDEMLRRAADSDESVVRLPRLALLRSVSSHEFVSGMR